MVWVSINLVWMIHLMSMKGNKLLTFALALQLCSELLKELVGKF